MSNKSTKFTLEIKGIELPKAVQEEISKALNQTLMQKIGEIDLAKNFKKGTPRPQSFSYNIIRPDGGRIEQLMSSALKDLLNPKNEITNVIANVR